MTQVEFLRNLCDLVDEVLTRHGLALQVADGQCLEPGHVVLYLPCPANPACAELAARTGASVIMRLQIDVEA